MSKVLCWSIGESIVWSVWECGREYGIYYGGVFGMSIVL